MALTLPARTAEAAVVMCDGHPATIVGTSGDDTLIGTPGRDVIAPRGGDDVVRGRGGNDRFMTFADDGETERNGDSLRGGTGGTGRDHLVPGRDTRVAGQVDPDQILWDTAPGPSAST
jgi:Ca2+-binding RTX toxin-like protein